MFATYDTVLCPTDLSATGNHALALAYRVVALGGTVHLLHACEPPHFENPLYDQYVHGYVPTQEETESGRERVKQELHALAPDGALEMGIRTQFHIIDGVNVAETIRAQYAALGADAIVMGTHGRTGLGKLLLGSVASDVLKMQDATVILVKGTGDDA